MLPELSLSWRFIKPVRGLLIFLVVLLASFIALGQLYWQAVQAYNIAIPHGSAPANYQTVGSDQLSESGMLDSCMVATLNERGNFEDTANFFQLYQNNWLIRSDDGKLEISPDDVHSLPANFIEFFGITPVEQFFDHNTMHQARWVYVRDSWWQANQNLVSMEGRDPSLRVTQKVDSGDQIVRSTEVLPIAGVLPDDFWPFQDKRQGELFVSNGMAYWYPSLAASGDWFFGRPQNSLFIDQTWTRTIVKLPDEMSAEQLQTQLNTTPAPCANGASFFKVLPGTRSDAPSYQSQRESASLLSLIVLVVAIITFLYSIAVAQRLQIVRQQEFLLKVAIGGSPARLAKQISIETILISLVAVLLSVLIYLPLNAIAPELGFAKAHSFSVLPWLLLTGIVAIIGAYLVLASRKIVDPEYVYEGLTNLRHKISHKFWWLQINHTIYLMVLASAVLVMGLISSAYWRQLTPSDALANSHYKILIDEWRTQNGDTMQVLNFDESRDILQILRENRDDTAKLCFDQLAISVQVVDSERRPEVIIQGLASYSFFDHVLDLGSRDLAQRGSRDNYLSQSAADKLALTSDVRDMGDVKLATVPRLNSNSELEFYGRASIQQVLAPVNLPNQPNAPIMFQPQLVPRCNGVIWANPDFNLSTLDEVAYTVAIDGERIGFKLVSWQEYMILAQPIAGQRLRLVLTLSGISLAALMVIILLNTQFLFKRMQPWYWLNIAQGMSPRLAKMQTQLRIGVLSGIALTAALVVSLLGFYEFFPLVAQWLPQRNALNTSIVITVTILVVQQISLWWYARSLGNKDLSAWRV